MGGIRLRPHHLLCIHGFRGQGYSPTFIANFARLKELLDDVPETPVEIAAGIDDICSFCPHLGEGYCNRPGQRVGEMDHEILGRLGIATGEHGAWSQFVDSVRQKIYPSALEEICEGCRWVDLGFCARGIAALSASAPLD